MDEKWKDMQILGLGFRGKMMGEMVYSGIQVKREKVIMSFSVQGKPIESEMKYTVSHSGYVYIWSSFSLLFSVRKINNIFSLILCAISWHGKYEKQKNKRQTNTRFLSFPHILLL